MMRGDCRAGSIKVAGFATPAARYCGINARHSCRSGSASDLAPGLGSV